MNTKNNNMQYLQQEAPKVIKGILKQVKSNLRKKQARDTLNTNSVYLRGSLTNLKKSLELLKKLLPLDGVDGEIKDTILICSESWSAVYAASFIVLAEVANCVDQIQKKELFKRLSDIFQLNGQWLESPHNSGTAKPKKYKELLARIETLAATIEQDKQSENYRCQLLSKLHPCIDRISNKGLNYSDCKKIDKFLSQWVSNRHRVNEHRLMPLLDILDDDFLDFYVWSDHAKKVFKAIRGKPAASVEGKPESPSSTHSDKQVASDQNIKRARAFLEGKRLSVIGSPSQRSRERHGQVLKNKFGLSDVSIPAVTGDDPDWKKYRSYVNKSDLVIFLVGQLKHQISEHLRDYCNEKNVAVLFLPKNCGLNPNRVAPHIVRKYSTNNTQEM